MQWRWWALAGIVMAGSLGAILFSPSISFAVSGACSWHEGINCSYGRDWDGSVVCNDGWKDSISSYEFTEKCSVACIIESHTGCKNEGDLGKINALNVNRGLPGSDFASANNQNCEEEIASYQAKVQRYNDCQSRRWTYLSYTPYVDTYTEADRQRDQAYSDDLQNRICLAESNNTSYYDTYRKECVECRIGETIDPVSKNRCVSTTKLCQEQFGLFSTDVPGSRDRCMCISGYQWNAEGTECVWKPTIPLPQNTKISTPPGPQVLGISYLNPLGFQSGWLIKNKKYIEVFYVNRDLCLQWIVDEKSAYKHFGTTWNYEGNIKEFEGIPKDYKYCSNLE